MRRTVIAMSMGTLMVSSALAQQPAPPPPTEGNIPPAANETMAPIAEPFGGDVNAGGAGTATTVETAPPSPADTPSAETPTEGTSAGPIPTTGPDAVPERADGAAENTSVPAGLNPNCAPADGPSVSETQPVEGEGAGTAPGGSGSTGWTGGLGGSDIGTSQAEPLPTSPTQAPHPEVASGLDPISGQTNATGPASPPPPVEVADAAEADATPAPRIASAASPSGEDTPSADAELVPPAANAQNLQQPGATRPAGADPC